MDPGFQHGILTDSHVFRTRHGLPARCGIDYVACRAAGCGTERCDRRLRHPLVVWPKHLLCQRRRRGSATNRSDHNFFLHINGRCSSTTGDFCNVHLVACLIYEPSRFSHQLFLDQLKTNSCAIFYHCMQNSLMLPTDVDLDPTDTPLHLSRHVGNQCRESRMQTVSA